MFFLPSCHFKQVRNTPEHKQKLLDLFSSYTDKKYQQNPDEDAVTDWFYCHKNRVQPEYYSYVCNALKGELKEINNYFGFHDTRVTDMWFQQTVKSQRHGAHTHGSVGLSCIWYLEFDPTAHQPTLFHAPFTHPLTGANLEFQPQVDEGDLFVFPSYVYHEHLASYSDKRRTVISFNILRDRTSKELGTQLYI